MQTQNGGMEVDQPVASTSATPATAETTSGDAEKAKKKKRKADAIAAYVFRPQLQYESSLNSTCTVMQRTRVSLKAL